MSTPLRLFIGVYPPLETTLALLAALDDLGGGPARLPRSRPTPPEQVHLTLQFIGPTPAKEMDAVIESVERATRGVRPISLKPLRLITLPERGPARLLAARTNAPPPLLEIKDRVVKRLARSRGREHGKPFRPHLTLCRFRAPARMPPVDHPLATPAFSVGEVRLMRSTLLPAGVEHAEVESFCLNG